MPALFVTVSATSSRAAARFLAICSRPGFARCLGLSQDRAGSSRRRPSLVTTWRLGIVITIRRWGGRVLKCQARSCLQKFGNLLLTQSMRLPSIDRNKQIITTDAMSLHLRAGINMQHVRRLTCRYKAERAACHNHNLIVNLLD